MNKDIRSKDLYKIVRQIELINHQIQVIQNHIFNTEKSFEPEEFINTNEVAKLMRISVSRVYVLSALEFIPSRKLGKKLLFNRNEIIKLIQNGFSVTVAEENKAREIKRNNKITKSGKLKKEIENVQ